MVVYRNGDKEVKFILNYNSFEVKVKLSETESYKIGKYDFVRIEK